MGQNKEERKAREWRLGTEKITSSRFDLPHCNYFALDASMWLLPSRRRWRTEPFRCKPEGGGGYTKSSRKGRGGEERSARQRDWHRKAHNVRTPRLGVIWVASERVLDGEGQKRRVPHEQHRTCGTYGTRWGEGEPSAKQGRAVCVRCVRVSARRGWAVQGGRR